MSPISILSWFATAPFFAILLFKVTMLLSLGAVVAFVYRNGAPAIQHYAWTAGLCGALLLPVMMAITPAWRVGVLPASFVSRTTVTSSKHISTQTGSQKEGQALASRKSHTGIADQEYRVSKSNADASTWGSSLMTRARSWWPFVLWFLGSCICLVRIAVGRYGLRRLQYQVRPITTNAWRTDLEQECARAGVSRPIRLYSSAAVTTPLTWGTRAAVIALPDHMIDCAAEHRVMVLRHELAHVARNDALTHLVAALTCALYWFHPLVWIAARHQRRTCEHACDAQVLSYGTPAAEYAMQLLELARSARIFGPRGYIALAMARPLQLERRLLAILNTPVRHLTLSRGARVASAATSLVAIFVTSAFRPVPRPPTNPFTRIGNMPKTQTLRPAAEPISVARSLDTSAMKHHESPSAARQAGAARAQAIASDVMESTLTTRDSGTLVLDLGPDDIVDITRTNERRVSVYVPSDWYKKNVRLEQTDSGAKLVRRDTGVSRTKNSSHLFRVRVPRHFKVSSANTNMNITLHNVEGMLPDSQGVSGFTKSSEIHIVQRVSVSRRDTNLAPANQAPFDQEALRKQLRWMRADTTTLFKRIDSVMMFNKPHQN
jgi:beta-lactamase regulating signal transducer with metallopeptidase domain